MSDNDNTPPRRIRFVDLVIFVAALAAFLFAALFGLVAWLGADRLAHSMPESGGTEDPVATLASLGITFGAALPAVGLAVLRHGRHASRLLGLVRCRSYWLWLFPIGITALSFVADDAILWAVSKVLGEDSEPTIVALMTSIAKTPLFTFLAVLVVGVLGPVVEELVFRGLVYGYVEGRFGGIAAMIVSTVLFAAAHIEPAHVAVVVPMGLLLGWARMRTGSIWPTIAAHIANNTVATLAVYLFG